MEPEAATPAGRDVRAQRATVIAFAVVVVMIGSNLVSVRVSDRELEPFWGAGARFTIAALLFLALMRARRVPFPRGRALIGALLFGLIGIGAFFAFAYVGLVEVEAGTAAVLASLTPLLTLFLAIVQRQERFRFTGLLGALIATAGTAIVFREQLGADVPVWSIVAVLLASACAAEGGVVLKRFPPTDPVSTNAVAMSVGAIVLLGLSLVAGETWIVPEQNATWVAFAYLSTLGTLGTFLLYLFVLRTWTASAASYEFVLAPIVAIALAAWLLDESVSTGFFLGGALVLAGVYVGALMPSRETPATLPGRPETP